MEAVYRVLGQTLKRLPTWSHYVLTSYRGFEHHFGRRADRRRKLYNGRLECQYYQYQGPRPPRADDEEQSDRDNTDAVWNHSTDINLTPPGSEQSATVQPREATQISTSISPCADVPLNEVATSAVHDGSIALPPAEPKPTQEATPFDPLGTFVADCGSATPNSARGES